MEPFRERLDKSERKIFDEMMSISRLYSVAGAGSCKPVLLHPILMSIIFEHYKQLEKNAKSRRRIKVNFFETVLMLDLLGDLHYLL